MMRSEYLLYTLFALPMTTLSQSPFEGIPMPTNLPKVSQACPAQVGSMRGENATVRRYLVGGNSWHVPILDYLTHFVGNEFDPPIEFWRRSANDFLISDSKAATQFPYDFVISNAHRASCFDTEVRTVPLANQIQFFPKLEEMYQNFSQIGAVLYVLKNRTDIKTIADIKEKKIGTNKLTNLATNLCYHVLLQNGIHHLQDPKQTIFFRRSTDALAAVLDGRVDVGCASTGTLESYIDPNTNEPLSLDRIRVLNPQMHTSDGLEFPFQVSSKLVPGYLFSAYPHIEGSVINKVQEELLAMREHADVAPSLLACLETESCLVNYDSTYFEALNGTDCVQDCFARVEDSRNCNTTPQRALQAYAALQASNIVGFIPPLQNHDMRDIQEETGFLKKSLTSPPACVRLRNLEDAVTCPPGHFARSTEEIVQQCNVSTFECYDRPCICKPCVKAFEVDFFPIETSHEGSKTSQGEIGSGCSKFSLCGNVEQGNVLGFKAIDNRGRPNTTMSGSLLLPDESEETFHLRKVGRIDSSTYFTFNFDAEGQRVGQKTIKIYISGEEIPESPFRVNVLKRDCPSQTGDEDREADEFGECVCRRGTVEISYRCVSVAVPIVISCLATFLLIWVGFYFYLRHKREQADNIWRVKPESLHFDDPPRVLGRGSFGLVVLAQYRGTKVAVKGILPPDYDGAEATPYATTLRHRNNGTPKVSKVELPQAHRSRKSRVRETFVEATNPVSKRRWFHSSSKAILRESFVQEIRLLSRLRHPNITCVMGAILSTKWEPMLVMEYMHFGSLHDLIHNQSVFLESQTLIEMLRDVASGLRFLHSSDPVVLHGDLKCRNILVDEKFRAKVSDFGCGSRHAVQSALESRLGRNSGRKPRGTPFWMAPELLRGKTSNTIESDVYSFGVVLYEVFSRKEPYEGEDPEEVFEQLISEGVRKTLPRPEKCPDEIATMMSACLQWDPTERPKATGLAIRLSWMVSEQKKKVEVQTLDGTSFEQNCPRNIIAAIEDGQQIQPETYDEVTVVCVSVANYPDIVNTLSSKRISKLLSDLQVMFDNLCAHLKVFQVHTTDDSFMFVTNLDIPQTHHASLAAKFAVEAVAIAESISLDDENPERASLKLRVGIHSGSAVAHVIGTKNTHFTLIGDSVNTASMVEATSEDGRVQCSEDTHRLLSNEWGYNEFIIEERGVLEVNGVEEMMTYWIESDPEKMRAC